MDKLIARTVVAPLYVSEQVFPIRAGSLQIFELPLAGIIRLQGRTDDPEFRASVSATVSVQLPLAETFSPGADVELAWVGPNEYLCFCPLDAEERTFSALTAALAGQFATATLYSDSRVCFLITGTDATAFLAKGCSIDMHPASFPVGRVVTTRFADLPAMVMHRNEGEFVVYFDVSYIEFALKWILDAAEEFIERTA
ncbi:sarcosine oxidase subunit gamma family protein [Burkholderia sp. Ac-20353]|uniref:sarcosine oxidase subunit gamma n=1 Tax=Burkholderia sp. Ac-20353 TaxID=2703894 RepID=UPI00197B83FA|nr:sarcosine oxidase subunit gamma family protein [Burkholderia sp. Ac-20353]MBN3786546.1 hypothetical protein [Burkholderia sp. Ac-20353]